MDPLLERQSAPEQWFSFSMAPGPDKEIAQPVQRPRKLNVAGRTPAFSDRQGLAVVPLGLGFAAGLFADPGQPPQWMRQERMFRPRVRFPNLQKTPEQRLGLGVLALFA